MTNGGEKIISELFINNNSFLFYYYLINFIIALEINYGITFKVSKIEIEYFLIFALINKHFLNLYLFIFFIENYC